MMGTWHVHHITFFYFFLFFALGVQGSPESLLLLLATVLLLCSATWRRLVGLVFNLVFSDLLSLSFLTFAIFIKLLFLFDNWWARDMLSGGETVPWMLLLSVSSDRPASSSEQDG
jgi:hypothetical protein